VELVAGDLADARALRDAVAGTEVIFHLAAATRARSEAEFHSVNAGGTRALLEAVLAGAPGLGRFVHVSSQSAVGPSPGRAPLTEEAPPRPVSAYGRSKLAAERVCREYAGRIPMTVVRPPAVYGPRDRDFLSLFRAVARGLHPLVGFGSKYLSIVHARDLASGIALAGWSPRGEGQTYFLAGPAIHERGELGEAAERALGRRALRVRIPAAGMYAWAAAAGFASRLARRPALVNLDKARDIAQDNWTCDSSKARAELGFEPRLSLEAGVEDTVAWYRAHGWMN
jgi:nucleoside-diphosphate-sugar epimerase